MICCTVRIYRIHRVALDRLCSLWSALVQMDNESAGFGVLDVWLIENLEIVPTLKLENKEQNMDKMYGWKVTFELWHFK